VVEDFLSQKTIIQSKNNFKPSKLKNMKYIIIVLVAMLGLTSCESDHIQVLQDNGEIANVYDHKRYRKVTDTVVIETISSSRTGSRYYINRVYNNNLPESKIVQIEDDNGSYNVSYTYRKGVIIRD